MRILFTLSLGLLAAVAYAGDACTPAVCDPGCDPSCQTSCAKRCFECTSCPRCGSKLACKVVCAPKEIKKTVWNVKCEPICTTLPRLCHDGCGCGNKDCGGNCDTGETPTACGCADGKCGKSCDPCAVEKAKCIVPPRCGIVRSKKTLEKKEVVCKVPGYKCIPVCPCCGHGDPNAKNCGTDCGPASPAPVENSAPMTAPAPAPAPAPKTTQVAPLPPVLSVHYGR